MKDLDILEFSEEKFHKRQKLTWRIRNRLVSKIIKWYLKKFIPLEIPDPSIDEKHETYSFFSKPSMQLGMPGEQYATQVTYEGWLYTGAAEIIFFLGDPLIKINERIWTLEKGYLPAINYTLNRDGIEYHFKIFQFWLNFVENQVPINFIKINAINNTSEERNVSIGLGCAYGGKYHRSTYTTTERGIRKTYQMKFKKNWTYEFIKNKVALRENEVIYVTDENIQKRFAVEKGDKFIDYIGNYLGKDFKICEKTSVLISNFRQKIKPKESKSWTFKAPLYPIPAGNTSIIQKLMEANFNQYLDIFERYWENILEKCAQIEVPEAKATNTHKTSLIFNFMCQNYIENGTIEQHVNRFNYNFFWIRDSSFFSKMYLVFNRPDVSRKILLHFLKHQEPNGNFASHKGQLDGWGQTLWAFGEYVKYSKDKEFAKLIFEPIKKALDWFESAIQDDRWGIMPSTSVLDNEYILGRYTGHNFWALFGLNNAIEILDFLGASEEKLKTEELREKFKENFFPILEKMAKHNNNYVPPGLDTDYGEDWGNLLLLYPQKLFPVDNELVNTTLNKYREDKMIEGLATWQIFLHHYLIERITQNEIVRGNQALVLHDFYSILSHTGSCNEGFEMAIRPWGNRDHIIPIKLLFFEIYINNFPPHGWFAVTYNLILRNMLIREEDNDLHIFSVISPAWLDGEINVKNANTLFGIVNIKAFLSENDARLSINSKWERSKPKRIVIHIPFFVDADFQSIECSNANFKIRDTLNRIEIPPKEEIQLVVNWKINGETDISYFSYKNAVEWLKSEYKKRYIENLKNKK